MTGEPFVFLDRRAAFDIDNLLAALNEDVSDDEFASYVGHDKNDFANWIEYSLQNKSLADKIRPLMERDLIKAVLADAIGKETAKMIIGDTQTRHNPIVHEVLEKNIDFEEQRKEDMQDSQQAVIVNDSRGNNDVEKKKEGSSLAIGFPLKLDFLLKIHKKMVVADFLFGLICGMLLGVIVLEIILRLML